MREEVKRMLNWVIEHIDEVPWKCGIFSTANIVGDSIEVIYNNDGIVIGACLYWDYIEIFGLTDDEFKEVQKRIIEMRYEELYREEE